MLRALFGVIFLWALFPGRALGGNLRVEGTLVERGTKKPLASVNVYLLPSQLKAITDKDGKFAFENVSEGEIEWVVNLPGYRTHRESDFLDEKSVRSPRRLYLEKTNYNVFETTVFGRQERRDDTVKTMTAEQFSSLPASGGDPLRAIQNMPGMARSSFGTQAIVQGSAPKDTRYWVDGHEVPLSFHVLGNTSVLQPEAVDRVDYFAAGYGPERGRANGGLIGLWSRAPRTDRIHGMGYVDLYNGGLMVEGPIDAKSSFLIGARRSYVDLLLGQISGDEFTVAPNFSDFNAIYELEATPIDRFRILTIGSVDTIDFIAKNPSKESRVSRGEYYYRTAYARVIPQLIHRHSEITSSRWSFSLGRDWETFRSSATQTRYYQLGTSVGFRGEVERKMQESWTTAVGLDQQYTSTRTELDTRTSAQEIAGEAILRSNNSIGVYFQNTIKPEDTAWTFLPGIRADYFSSTGEVIPEPRVGLRYAIDESQTLRASGGLYSQPPLPYETDANYGNPELKAPRSWHFAMATEKDFRGRLPLNTVLTTGTFYRYFDSQVVPTSAYTTRGGYTVPEVYNNGGRGRAFGLEALVKVEQNPWKGWVAYTVSRSTRWDAARPEYLFQYDQTHNVNLIGSVDLVNNWRISTRFRYVTGNPVTPVQGSFFDADAGTYSPVFGPFYSERLGSFVQLDLRVDKKWITDLAVFSAYLDILNVTNRKNPEFVVYSFDYASKDQVSGLPIIPTIGLKVEL